MSRSTRLPFSFALIATVALTSVACGGGGEEGASDGAATDGEVEIVERTTTTVAAAKCTPEILQPAVTTDYPDTEVRDPVCSSTVAIATLSGGTLGDGVVYLRTEGTDWVLISAGPAADASRDTLPEEVPSILFDRWKSKHDRAQAAATSTTTTTDPGTPGTIDGAPPETASTLTTTTTVPPSTEPPTTPPRQIDPYCLQYPSEPSCIEDPYLPG